MYTETTRAASSYAKVDVEVGVMSASPQALVVMLYDGAIKAIALARAEMLRKDFAAKGEQLSKAIGIIDEGLNASLDLEAGGEIALNLAALYDYMTRQLMVANLRNALLLATSNRSEAAVGYATMDGDTCGGLSPIAGIDKAFLRCWLVWMEQEGILESGPIAELRLINVQTPTAELRPSKLHQTDENDLMPYPVLDAIERAAIRDKQSPLEVYLETRVHFEYPRWQMALWVEKFFILWSRNQWKRERYAPSFHVDDENLDPKTWCRFPILSGGFSRELSALKAFVEKEGSAET